MEVTIITDTGIKSWKVGHLQCITPLTIKHLDLANIRLGNDHRESSFRFSQIMLSKLSRKSVLVSSYLSRSRIVFTGIQGLDPDLSESCVDMIGSLL